MGVPPGKIQIRGGASGRSSRIISSPANISPTNSEPEVSALCLIEIPFLDPAIGLVLVDRKWETG
jgi:hypothetical protein